MDRKVLPTYNACEDRGLRAMTVWLKPTTNSTRIRGVGRKIASFFLRDTALRYQIEPATDRHLLQPGDLWIRRFVECWMTNSRRRTMRPLDGGRNLFVA